MNHKLFKKMVNWLGMLILVHLISMFLYGFFISNTVSSMYIDNYAGRANMLVLIFSIFIDVLFVTFTVKTDPDDTEKRKALKEKIKAGEFSIVEQIKGELLKESLIKAGIYFVFQIPYAIYYSILGYNPNYTLKLAQFYSLDSAFYMMTDSSVLGMILRSVLFAAVNVFVTLFLFSKKRKSLKRICFNDYRVILSPDTKRHNSRDKSREL